jgi:hypothetical protein
MRFRWAVMGGGLALAVAGVAAAGERGETVRRAEALVKRAEEAGAREFAPTFRAALLRKLIALSPEELQAREGDEPARGVLALGDSSSQLVYTPVPPCRIIDTRAAGAGGPLVPGAVRDFRVSGPGSLASQGGSAAGCAVPFGPATAAVINFVAVGPAGAGNLRAWAYATPPPAPPAASILNYTTVSGAPALNVANGIVVPLCDSTQTACSNLDLRVRADASATHLVADVMGYYERFPKAQARAFSEVDNMSTATIMQSACTHVEGADVTVVAPVAGRVVVRALVPHRIQQDNAGDRVLILGIGDEDDDCTFTNFAHSKIMDEDITEDFLMTVSVTAVFDVTAGTHNYFLNGRMTSGGGNAVVVPGTLVEATFHPN